MSFFQARPARLELSVCSCCCVAVSVMIIFFFKQDRHVSKSMCVVDVLSSSLCVLVAVLSVFLNKIGASPSLYVLLLLCLS